MNSPKKLSVDEIMTQYSFETGYEFSEISDKAALAKAKEELLKLMLASMPRTRMTKNFNLDDGQTMYKEAVEQSLTKLFRGE